MRIPPAVCLDSGPPAALPEELTAAASAISARAHVADAMVTRPKLYSPTLSVGELRKIFADDHVHMILLADHGVLISALERPDLDGAGKDARPAVSIGRVNGRTVKPGAGLRGIFLEMHRSERRRLAVVDRGHAVVGLLCLKASGLGFCSDADVRARAEERASGVSPPTDEGSRAQICLEQRRNEMPGKSAHVKNERQYEALKDKGMSKERAAKIANSPGASSRGGKSSASSSSSQRGTTAQKKAAGRKGGKATARNS